MTQRSPIPEKRRQAIASQLEERLVDDDGSPPPRERIEAVVEEKAQELADAPVQDYVPLLTEHKARDELMDEGFHPDPTKGPDDDAPPRDTAEEDTGELWGVGGIPHPTT
jgi:hypothetical protein